MALSDSQKRAQEHLEALPHKLLGHARVFNDHVQYFTGGSQGAANADLPAGLKKLMEDVMGSQKLAEKIKGEILEDQDAKNVSCSKFPSIFLGC